MWDRADWNSMKGRRKWANDRDEDEIRWVEEISEDSMGKTSIKCMGSGEGDRWLGRKKGKLQINRNEQHSESIKLHTLKSLPAISNFQCSSYHADLPPTAILKPDLALGGWIWLRFFFLKKILSKSVTCKASQIWKYIHLKIY